jgi:lysylphosphatidylglycerol synthetase-like protein (DUF2156 family)
VIFLAKKAIFRQNQRIAFLARALPAWQLLDCRLLGKGGRRSPNATSERHFRASQSTLFYLARVVHCLANSFREELSKEPATDGGREGDMTMASRRIVEPFALRFQSRGVIPLSLESRWGPHFPQPLPKSILDPTPRDVPVPPPPPFAATSRWLEMFYRYGNFTMAYATLQPGMKYFEAFGGYLAYDTSLGITFVLGDPVAPPEMYQAIIEAFIKKHPRSCFCQVSRPMAEVLSRLGWYVNEFGADIELDLPSYNFDGPKKSKLRQAANKVAREGYTIVERTTDEIDPHSLEALSADWRATKRVKREARFLVRPMSYDDEPEVRKFCLLNPTGEIVAFVAFDPICERGEIIGYSPAIKRRSPTAPTGAEEAITKYAIERFREEGLAVLRLGLLPFYQIEDSGFRESVLLKKAFQWLYRTGDRWLYSFRGHADFKHRYRGTVSKVYFGTFTRWRNAINLLALMRLCRFI